MILWIRYCENAGCRSYGSRHPTFPQYLIHNIVSVYIFFFFPSLNVSSKLFSSLKLNVDFLFVCVRNLRRFGNQFRPYNGVFDCDLRADSELDSYGGTLFRFPLRTKAQAQRSEICRKHYDDKEVDYPIIVISDVFNFKNVSTVWSCALFGQGVIA